MNRYNTVKNCFPRTSKYIAVTAQGKIIPTGPLVNVAAPIRSVATKGKPFMSLSVHRYNWYRDVTINSVNTISTRDAIAARCTSKQDKKRSAVRKAKLLFLLRA